MIGYIPCESCILLSTCKGELQMIFDSNETVNHTNLNNVIRKCTHMRDYLMADSKSFWFPDHEKENQFYIKPTVDIERAKDLSIWANKI